MTYNDPVVGIIDLSSEELPKSVTIAQKIFAVLKWICIVFGILFFIGLLFEDFSLALFSGIAFSLMAWFCELGSKKSKDLYYKRRALALQKIKSGAIKLPYEANFHGIIISRLEVGTNSPLGWVRGVEQTSNIVPVSARFTFTNSTKKEIKYLILNIRPYNAVGDPVSCTVQDVSLYNCKCTGPFSVNGQYTQTLIDAWYNISIASIRVEGAEIIYMDNTTEVLNANQIKVLEQNRIFSDNDSRIARKKFAEILMIVSGIIDVICIIGTFAMDSTLFSILLVISSIAFFVGLKMKY